jgi:P-type E1-E2 ATPase
VINRLTVEEDKDTSWIEGAAIMVSVVVVVLVTAFNDLQKERQFQALQDQQDKQKVADVIRNGTQSRISVYDLVVGDILVLTTGAILPCDGILVRSCWTWL